MNSSKHGGLIVVGTGIRAIAQITTEATSAIRDCDQVFFLVQDSLSENHLRQLNHRAESLVELYEAGLNRKETYRRIVNRILDSVRSGLEVCAAFYGHPGVFAEPGHSAVRAARAEGFPAEMLPGVSAEDCMFADLGVDPGQGGCQSFEATDFLIRDRTFDASSHLVLWQAGAIGVSDFRRTDSWNPGALSILAGTLAQRYGSDHEVTLYEAASYPTETHSAIQVPIGKLAQATVTLASTIYVPPIEDRPVNDRLLRLLRATIPDLDSPVGRGSARDSRGGPHC
jgi:uncharacterized protein YabN with tetrapyrrole methylase and pyrophosphatase domain